MNDDHAEPHGTWAAFKAHLLRGLAITGPLILGSLLIESSRFGERLSLLLYEVRGQTLGSDAADVVIADVTGMPVSLGSDERANVSREALMVLLKQLKSHDPLAIGIDIDLAPSDTGLPYDKQDADLFILSHDLGVPVVVGVYREIDRPWPAVREKLESPDMFPQAGHLLIPDAEMRIVPSWIRNRKGHALHGLAAAMVKTQGPLQAADWYPDWMASGAVELGPKHDAELGTYALIDCSGAARLNENSKIKIDFTRSNGPESEWICTTTTDLTSIRNKYVLVGMADTTNAKDNSFHVPPDFRRNYPGVYMHGCAIDTFQNGYLYRPTVWLSLLLDLGAALVFLIGSGFVSTFGRGESGKTKTILIQFVVALGFVFLSVRVADLLDWLSSSLFLAIPWILFALSLMTSGRRKVLLSEIVVALLLVLLSIHFGMVLIRRTHLIWDGFVFVSLGLGMHLLVDRWLERTLDGSKRARAIAWFLVIACFSGTFGLAVQHHRVEDERITGPPTDRPLPPGRATPSLPPGTRGGVERSGGDEWVRGREARGRGNIDEAIEAFYSASQSLKTEATLWIDLADALMKRRKPDDLTGALSAADKAIGLAPKDWRTHYSLACAEALRGDSTAALDAFEESVKCNPIAKTTAITDDDLAGLRPLARFRALVGP